MEVIRCEEWQCRYVFPDRMCCVRPIGHEGEHQTTCGHGWHFGGRCTDEVRIVARDPEVTDMTSTPQQELNQADDDPNVTMAVTAIVREADEVFQRVGGSSRHWVRECFLPILNRKGWMVQRSAPAHALGAVKSDGESEPPQQIDPVFLADGVTEGTLRAAVAVKLINLNRSELLALLAGATPEAAVYSAGCNNCDALTVDGVEIRPHDAGCKAEKVEQATSEAASPQLTAAEARIAALCEAHEALYIQAVSLRAQIEQLPEANIGGIAGHDLLLRRDVLALLDATETTP